MRRLGLAALVLATLWPRSTEAADLVEATRSALLREKSHVVHLHIGPESARLVVHRTVHNGGERHDQALFWLDVPSGSVATGLRTLGELDGRPKWFAGELMEAEAAATKYRELTGIGGYTPKDPALLSWRSQTELALQVFPCSPGADKTVEYTLTLPVTYSAGRHRLVLPPLGTETHPADVVLAPEHALDQVFVDGKPVGTGSRISATEEVEIALARRDAPSLFGRFAAVPTGRDARHVLHWALDAGPRISEVPRNAHIVVLLDASHSRDEGQLEAQVQATQLYLEHFAAPRLRAKAAVILYDRRARPRTAGLVSVREAIDDLEGAVITPHNGSDVEVGLRAAEVLLASAPKGAPRRVLVLGDAMTASHARPQRIRTLAARTGAVVHLAEIDLNEPSLERLAEHPWIDAAHDTGGLAWAGSVLRSPDATASRTIEELARPVRVHDVRVKLRDVDTGIAEGGTLDEGERLELLAVSEVERPLVVLDGALWSTPLHRTWRPDAQAGDVWSALVFGSDILSELDEAEMMPLALRGRAVSPVTSYLAIEPGVRPSTEGLEHEGIGLMGIGAGGGGSGVPSIRMGSGKRSFDHAKFLRERLRKAGDSCGATGKLDAVLETTLAEIVAVDGVALDDTLAQSCVTEQLWAVQLPRAFVWPWRSWSISTE